MNYWASREVLFQRLCQPAYCDNFESLDSSDSLIKPSPGFGMCRSAISTSKLSGQYIYRSFRQCATPNQTPT